MFSSIFNFFMVPFSSMDIFLKIYRTAMVICAISAFLLALICHIVWNEKELKKFTTLAKFNKLMWLIVAPQFIALIVFAFHWYAAVFLIVLIFLLAKNASEIKLKKEYKFNLENQDVPIENNEKSPKPIKELYKVNYYLVFLLASLEVLIGIYYALINKSIYIF